MRHLKLIFLIALLTGCNELSQKDLTPNTSAHGGDSAASAPNEAPSLIGASSGGGGFSDTYATETLTLAKQALAQIIENTSDEAFSQLPQEKNKAWMINIIRKIEVQDVEVSRYNRPLKFNYDLESEKIFATRHFVQSFPYGRFYTRPAKERVRILVEVYMDILHELSHFYEIGLTEESDVNSELWALNFIRHGLDEVYNCSIQETTPLEEGTKYIFKNFFIHAPTGVMQGFRYEQSLEETVEDGGSNLFPFITYDATDLENSGYWDIIFVNHISMGLQNSPELLKDSIYSAVVGDEEDDDEVMWFFKDITRTQEQNNFAEPTRIEVHEDEEGSFVPSHQIQNLIRSERDESSFEDFAIYGGLKNGLEEGSTIQWEGEYTSGYGHMNSEGESFETDVIQNFKFVLDKEDLTASYSMIAHPTDTTNFDEDMLTILRSSFKEIHVDFNCEHHIPTIEIEKFKGDQAKLQLLQD